MFVQACANYDDLIHRMAIYQNRMAARNTSLQTQLSQMPQQLSRPSQHKELAAAEEALTKDNQELREKASILLEGRDEARQRVDSLAVKLDNCRTQLQEALAS